MSMASGASGPSARDQLELHHASHAQRQLLYDLVAAVRLVAFMMKTTP
jgi:hypothetical protein